MRKEHKIIFFKEKKEEWLRDEEKKKLMKVEWKQRVQMTLSDPFSLCPIFLFFSFLFCRYLFNLSSLRNKKIFLYLKICMLLFFAETSMAFFFFSFSHSLLGFVDCFSCFVLHARMKDWSYTLPLFFFCFCFCFQFLMEVFQFLFSVSCSSTFLTTYSKFCRNFRSNKTKFFGYCFCLIYKKKKLLKVWEYFWSNINWEYPLLTKISIHRHWHFNIRLK